MLKRIGYWVIVAFLLFFLLSAPTKSGEVVEAVGKSAASGFETARDWVVDFMRDHEFMQGG